MAAQVAKVALKAAVIKPGTSALMQPRTLLADAYTGAIHRLLPFFLTLYLFLGYNFPIFERARILMDGQPTPEVEEGEHGSDGER